MTVSLERIGALTSKPYAFTARPWELKKYDTIDVFDSLGSNLIIDVRNSQIMRITPKINDSLNEEWISDKARFAYDLLSKWRFNTPLRKLNGKYVNISWKEALTFLKENIECSNTLVKLKLGNIVDLKTMLLTKKLILENNNVIYVNKVNSSVNLSLDLINKKKSFIILNLNLRLTNPILNLKLRRKSMKTNTDFVYIGPMINNTIYSKHLGLSLVTLNKLIKGKSSYSKNFSKEKTMILTSEYFDQGFHNGFDLKVITKYHSKMAEHLLSLKKVKPKGSYMASINYYIGQFFDQKRDGFTILQSSYVAKNLLKDFDLVLPTTTWLEAEQHFVNCFSKLQVTSKLLSSPSNCKDNEAILNYLLNEKSMDMTLELGCSTAEGLIIDKEAKTPFPSWRQPKKPLSQLTYNYHESDAFLLNSKNMEKSSRDFFKGKNDFLTISN